MADQPAIVIDNGSFSCKAGFAGETAPRSIYRSIVGFPRPKTSHLLRDKGKKEIYLGDEVLAELQFLIEYGVSRELKYRQIEKIWDEVITNQLHIRPDSPRPILVTENFKSRRADRRETAEYMFETLNSPALCLYLSPVLSFHASGRTTGTVIQTGHNSTDVVPIHDGLPILNKWRQAYGSGSDLTDYLRRKLRDRGYELYTGLGFEHARHIKEKHCYVPSDWWSDLGEFHESPHSYERTYTLPDGQIITIGRERFDTGKALFDPFMLDMVIAPLESNVRHAITNDDKDLENALSRNIVLAGGSALLPGLAESLKKEVDESTGNHTGIPVEVFTPPNPHLLTWVGGSMMAEHSSFKKRWITKEDYEESGLSIVKQKSL
ncbi:Actin/actin-like protein [Aspergillus sclerotiicarbonarius CBS 121057]|uniref:Actin/actin-like protein n=1 Tax=Aspergillus sclerotiicarbonarius (strain CBS 121057 / IBT 28362) TaxID=1448318 RepID=A0A319F880_ASPSB|nr:Actin/actin-like protein [Aspergillus sclerotiicarbonarius CBS 121057]